MRENILTAKHELNIFDLNFIFKKFKFDILIKLAIVS